MHLRSGWIVTGIALSLVRVAPADQIVQSGSLSGEGSQTIPVTLDAFDTLGGTRELNFVQLDLITSIRGGYEIDGSGGMIDIFARLTADYSLAGHLLAETEALIERTVDNSGSPSSVTVFDSDTPSIVINDPNGLALWIGTGDLTMEVAVDFVVTENPPDVIFFSAGGTVRYTVIYDYSEVPAEPCADVDGDGQVNVTDLGTLLLNFGQSGANVPGDVNDDGVVNVSDLGLLLEQFGQSCLP